MRSTILNGVCWVALGICLQLSAVATADATEGRPLEITKFTMQTTRTVSVPQSVSAIGGFVNEPYSFTQAGGHPQAITTTFAFATEEFTGIESKGEETHTTDPTRDPRDIVADLPPGLLGNPQAVPRSPLRQVIAEGVSCPSSTQVGIAVLHVFANKELIGPIVNLTPEAGQSAEFGIENDSKFTYVITAHVVREGNTYGFTAVSNELPMANIVGAELTFWGVPAEAIHNPERGLF